MSVYKKIYNIQQKIGAIKKDSKNPYFKSNYFDINKLIDELKPLLKEEQLAVLQPVTQLDGKPALKTIVVDTEDESKLEETAPLIELQDPQKMGACITYFRRYALQSLFLLEAEDDDGNTASGRINPVTEPEKRKVVPKITNSNEEVPFI